MSSECAFGGGGVVTLPASCSVVAQDHHLSTIFSIAKLWQKNQRIWCEK